MNNKKLEYRESDNETENGLPVWKCLHDKKKNRPIYEEINYDKERRMFI